MSYKLVFLASTLQKWKKLNPQLQQQFKKKLATRLQTPRIEGDRLSVMKDGHKIKLRSAGYRLVYQVRYQELVVAVVAVCRREQNLVYLTATL